MAWKFVCYTRLVKITRKRKREIAMLLQDSRCSIWRSSKWFSCARVLAREICVRGNVRNLFTTNLLTRAGPLKPILSALCVNIESLMRLPFFLPIYLTAFKAENPNARKKTKFDRRNHHFSFSPRLFTRSILAPQSSPTQSFSAEPWLAVKLIRSIRCDRHLRKWTMKRAILSLTQNFWHHRNVTLANL